MTASSSSLILLILTDQGEHGIMARSDQKTIRSRTETTTVDKQTGEVLNEQSTTTYKVPVEPEFVKLYVEAFTDELRLNGLHAQQIFHMVRRMDYDNVITLTPGARVRICEALRITVGTFNNYLNTLLEKDVFRRIGHGEFIANPKYISRGKYEPARQELYYKIPRVKTKPGRAPAAKNQQEMDLTAE